MRLIHLCFQLHAPYELRKFADGDVTEPYFDSKATFEQANKEIYQPLFALLERNLQKHSDFRLSLVVSGTWLDLAEKYDAELIRRLRLLTKQNRIELIAEPYYHSLAFFYNKEEFTEQVQLYADRVKDLFGVKCRLLALPDLMYNDALGKWAEGFGFAGMLVAPAKRALGWHSPNHVYEAAHCEYLRLLFQNWFLTDKIIEPDKALLVKTKPEAERPTFSAQKFQKMLDLECLRGNLLNLYFDASVIKLRRNQGIVGLFDNLIANWLAVSGNKFVRATEACVVETPSAEISVKETVSWKEDREEAVEVDPEPQFGLVMQREIEAKLPSYLTGSRQKAAEDLYKLRREIVASEDENLLSDFRKLTLLDFQEHLTVEMTEVWQAILQDLKRRSAEAKKSQAVEISRTYTKKRDRGLDNVVEVKIGSKPETKIEPVEEMEAKEDVVEATDVADTAVEVKITPTQVVIDEPEIELPSAEEEAKAEAAPAEKKHSIRKIIKRLVIE